MHTSKPQNKGKDDGGQHDPSYNWGEVRGGGGGGCPLAKLFKYRTSGVVWGWGW